MTGVQTCALPIYGTTNVRVNDASLLPTAPGVNPQATVMAIAIRNGLVIGETPVTMYFRQTGRPSKNAVWSALYLGRATLAIVATGLKGRHTSRGDLA